MWTLTDYFDGVWLPTGDIVVDKLPRSLYFGRMLAFDRTEPRLLYLVVGSDIFSYSCISGELKELCKILKEYGGRENCLGVIIPYELQNITPSIPKVKSKKKGKSNQTYCVIITRSALICICCSSKVSLSLHG